jgi:predicted butyrate kinase (DUF1464 family)
VLVLGIDPGTVTVDLCALHDGRVVLDRALLTEDALSDPGVLLGQIERLGRVDLVAGPSGYGLPLVAASGLTERDVRLACLSAPGEPGGIGGLGALLRALARTATPTVFTPGVVHLTSVPAHRKVNRVDMGTADKVCAAVLAVQQQATRRECDPRDVSLILVELGGAFTAAIAVDSGRIVDGVGGTSGPLGARAAGALDGEVAFLAGSVTKGMLFRGGAQSVADRPGFDGSPAARGDLRGRLAWEAYVEGAAKAIAALMVPVPRPGEIVLSGRLAAAEGLRETLAQRLAHVAAGIPIRMASGFADRASHAAQGAAIVAEGLAGGRWAHLVDVIGLREATGTVLDHLHVIEPAAARARLGIAEG